MAPIIRIDNVDAYYGAFHALRGVSIDVAPGERLGLFGHNGSGKSTLMKCCVGALPRVTGAIEFDGNPIAPGYVSENVKFGIGYVAQSRNVFKELSVERNLLIAGLRAKNDDMSPVWTRFPNLRTRGRQQAGSMSGGEQQMLAFSMALMTKPKALLLDEPTTGLSPAMAESVLSAITEVSCDLGLAIVVIEHNVPRTLAYTDRAVILKGGVIVQDCSAETLRERDDLWHWF